MKELVFEKLTTRQKLGMTFTAVLHGAYRTKEDDEFVFDLIRNHSLGAVWIQQGSVNAQEQMAKVKAIADYPILIVTDAESGMGEFRVGKHNAIGCTGSEKYAYAFGKSVGVIAREMGYNMVCDPVVDMCDGSMRSMGTDKHKVAAYAIAIARGMHDGGVLTMGKHYPGGTNENQIDSHMAESVSADTKEQLIDYSLYPYRKLNEEGLLDSIMVQHMRFYNIDPEHPATLSKPVIDIIRELGFDGIAMTDALCMMGIRAKFGDVLSKGLAVSAGIDLLLPYTWNNTEQFKQYCEAYEQGLVPDDMLDAAAKRVLAAQHKTTLLPQDTELTEEDIRIFHSINKDGVYTKVDKGISNTISRDGKHFFTVLAKQETDIASGGRVDVDTFSNGWHFPARITKKIQELFPNATVRVIHEFPSQGEMCHLLEDSLGCDELVFMTYSEQLAYTGKEHLTRRVVNLIEAMQLTNRISTLIHLGNPYVLEELPHISRCIFGGHSADSADTCLEVLAGEYPAKGVPTYEFTLK